MLNWDEYGKEEATSPPITPEIKKETPEVPEGTPRGVRIKRGCSE